MREIGGYIELDRYPLPMLHEKAVRLNCGRNCLAYLIRTRGIKKIRLPRFLCDSVSAVCEKESVDVRYYPVGTDLLPCQLELEQDEWLYVVNFYGQVDDAGMKGLAKKYGRVIADYAQAYFQEPAGGIDTLYTCRKFFGTPDGAFLYTDTYLPGLPRDRSYDRMRFLLGRFEESASGFYGEYVRNNESFTDEPIKKMSKLTENLLHGIDYGAVERRRTDNFTVLHDAFHKMNRLHLNIPRGAFMYPLWIGHKNPGGKVRRALRSEGIYIPTLWPDVFRVCDSGELEYDLAENILPLPVDQRYGYDDMQYIIERVNHHIK